MSILENIGASVASGIVSVAIAIAGFFGYTPETVQAPTEALGADTQTFFGGQTYTLAGTGISSSASSFTLTSFTIPQNGKKIQDSEMSDTFYGTFEPGSRARQEFFSCTTVTQNSDGTATITGCSRGLSPVTPYTASTSLQFAHGGGTSVIFSNTPQFYDQFTAKGNDETITGQWTFTTFPITASTSIASATTSGIVELATGAEAASSTLSGDITTSKLALHTAISTSSAPSSGNVVVVTGDDGNIDPGFVPTGAGSTSTIRTYTSTTTTHTWTKPAELLKVRVQLWGAGGGGGRGDVAGEEAGGGGGGGYFETWFDASTIPSTVEIVVGTGGASLTVQNEGNAGTASSFGSLAYAYGGGGGARNGSGACGGGGGGSYATGTSEGTGTCSTFGIDTQSTVSTATATTPPTAFSGSAGAGCTDASCATGGNAVWGGAGGGSAYASAATAGGTSKYGGNGGAGSQSAAATAGSQPGGGGGGSFGVASGAGGAGKVIITEYY